MRSSQWLLGLLALIVVLPGYTAPEVSQPRPDPAEKHIVFVVGEGEYQTAFTLPTFAEQHLAPRGFRYSFVYADPDEDNVFPGLEGLFFIQSDYRKSGDVTLENICPLKVTLRQSKICDFSPDFLKKYKTCPGRPIDHADPAMSRF